MSAAPPLNPILYTSPTAIFFNANPSIVDAAKHTAELQVGGAGA